MINKNDAIHSDQWRNLPMDDQMAWYIPLEIMIDIPSLRSKQPVILLSEYLLLQGLDLDRETTNGGWDRSYYHSGLDQPDLYIIPNRKFDPEGIVRVDSYVPKTHITRSLDGLEPFIRLVNSTSTSTTPTSTSNSTNSNSTSTNSTNPMDANAMSQWAYNLDYKLIEFTESKKKWAINWLEAKMIISEFLTITNDTIVEDVLERIGWAITHTYEGK
jgi:hypothetical protein